MEICEVIQALNLNRKKRVQMHLTISEAFKQIVGNPLLSADMWSFQWNCI